MRTLRTRFGQGLGEDVHRGRGAGSHRPGSLWPLRSRRRVPVDAGHEMLHARPGRCRTAKDRVVPRSRRRSLETQPHV